MPRDQLKILLLSDAESHGGAAIAASRLAAFLAARGCQILRVVRRSSGSNPKWATQELNSRAFRLLPRKSMNWMFPKTWTALARSLSGRNLQNVLDDFQPDIINIHNLHHGAARDGWSVDLVDRCARQAPTVWTFHDMWPITGRCAYSLDCRMFEVGCDHRCPTPNEYPQLRPDLIASEWDRKRKLAQSDANIVHVTPSKWLADQARSGILSGRDVKVIPNGVPLDIYKPLDRNLARASLGIQDDRPVIAFSAHDLDDKFKAMPILFEALRDCRNELIVLGIGHGDIPLAQQNLDIHRLGSVSDPGKQAMIYNAADVFLHPSIAENCALVLLESLACGTPCVGFPIGGNPEIINPGVSGWLANSVSASSLGTTIETALQEAAGLAAPTLRYARENYDLEKHGHRYLDLFQTML